MSIWNKYPHFDEDELRMLVALTAQVLLESNAADPEFPPDILEISPLAASRQLLPLLQATDASIDRYQIQHLLEDEHLSTQLSLKVLGEVRNYPELANRIDEAYVTSAKKMATPELLLLTGALVVLATRIKEIRWASKEKKITFYETAVTVKDFLVNLIKGAG